MNISLERSDCEDMFEYIYISLAMNVDEKTDELFSKCYILDAG